MAFQSQMTQGYPAESEIDAELASLGIELVTENNPNYTAEHKQQVWGTTNAARWTMTLGVYPATPTTFNVRGGKYLYKGTAKTYTPGEAIDPVDNDTTYIWMNPDNTIDSGIDGDGWPGTEHIKLGEVVVNSSGAITSVIDRRGEEFLRIPDPVTDVAAAVVCKDNQVICKNNEIVTKGV